MNILIIAAHPDDEVLGCGGIISRHIKKKDEVFVIILTDGVGAQNRIEKKMAHRQKAEECGQILGIKKIYFKDFSDQKLDALPLLDIVKEIESVVNEVRPEIIYTTHKGDINQDHRSVFEASLIAVRPINSFVKKIYSYELLSSTEWCPPFSERIFIPNTFIELDEDDINKKISAFKKYETEVKEWPHPRSEKGIRMLAEYRGAQSGQKLAEAFTLIREKSTL